MGLCISCCPRKKRKIYTEYEDLTNSLIDSNSNMKQSSYIAPPTPELVFNSHTSDISPDLVFDLHTSNITHKLVFDSYTSDISPELVYNSHTIDTIRM